MQKRQIFGSRLAVSASLCSPVLHRRPHYRLLWRLAMMPPLKMREQLVSESIILCAPRHSAGAIISHQFRAYRWTRRIWSCKHFCGKQEEWASGTARGAETRGLNPSAQSAKLKSLHKDRIDVPASVCIMLLSPCVVRNKTHAMHITNKLIVDGPCSVAIKGMGSCHCSAAGSVSSVPGNAWAQMSLKWTRHTQRRQTGQNL